MSPSKPAKVAVITRTKNRPLMLRRAINSVLNQTFGDWCHYIVNDGGDPSQVDELVMEYASIYDGRIEVLHNPTSFTMEAASNVGIIRGREEYIAIHDDDDTWAEAFLARSVSRLDQLSEDSSYGGVATQARVVVERVEGDTITLISDHIFDPYSHVSFMDMMWRNRFPPICLLFRRVAMEQVGYFDTNLPVLGDWDFHLRLYRQFRVEVIPEPLARYHHRPEALGEASNSVYKDSGKHLRYRSDYIDKIVRDELASGRLGYGQLLLHAGGMGMIESLEAAINQKLEVMKKDIVWEIKSHIDWRLSMKGENRE